MMMSGVYALCINFIDLTGSAGSQSSRDTKVGLQLAIAMAIMHDA
jgi:hypothetical protein